MISQNNLEEVKKAYKTDPDQFDKSVMAFLGRYKQESDTRVLQDSFSYAIYDFLKDKKEQGILSSLKQERNEFLEFLKK